MPKKPQQSDDRTIFRSKEISPLKDFNQKKPFENA